MSQAEDKLHEILGDPERLNQALELARLLKGNGSPASASGKTHQPHAEPAQDFDAAELLASLGVHGGGGAQGHHDHDSHHSQRTPNHGGPHPGGNMSAIADILPPLLMAFTGDCGTLCEDKVNLVKALRPYAARHCHSIDRAIRMAGIAKAAKSAIDTMSNKECRG